MKHVTVIGGGGFIGGRLVHQLRQSGIPHHAPDRHDEAALFGRPLGHVVYAAGLTADYAQRPFDTVEAHVSLLSRLLCEADFERLVYLSSTRLYDGLAVQQVDETAELRVSPAEPRHLYDLSKALGENLCLNAANGRAAVARLSCVYDTGTDATGFLPQLLRRMQCGRDIELDSSPGFERDYVHVDDVSAALLTILRASRPGIINVASGENTSNAAIAALAEELGWKIRFARQAAPPPAPVISVVRLRALGVTPRRTLEFLRRHLEGT